MKSGFFATVGTFDGVHLGHRLLLGFLKEEAEKRGLQPAAFVIDGHPLSLIAPHRAPRQLSAPAERLEMIEKMGIKAFPLHFTPQMQALTSGEFMANIVDEFGVNGLVVGHDNRFGSDRSATLRDYILQGERLGLEVVEAPVLEGISSSRVRTELNGGRVRNAADMLGRPYRLSGCVVHGKHLGSTIGFPTANLLPEPGNRLVPHTGVYLTQALLPGDEPHPAVTNIGIRPTVSNSLNPAMTIETHIPGLDRDLYGSPISLDFIDKIRDERRFRSLDELKAQIELDIEYISLNYVPWK